MKLFVPPCLSTLLLQVYIVHGIHIAGALVLLIHIAQALVLLNSKALMINLS